MGIVLLIGAVTPYIGGSAMLLIAFASLVTAGALLARDGWRGSLAAWLLLAVDVTVLAATAWEFLRPRMSCAYIDALPDPRCEPFLGFWNVYAVGAVAGVVVLVVGWRRVRALRAG